ncbi:hypothetical protein [Pedobacter metabolipauper]|uniref:GDSL-like lipase/acylhydrolase family protein n=1 Tax=Pedobacter metabolipauper TaxID=425513 RepID=A0A4R6T388_9SPHI|nr:hypothetical protein [Pedobacter metabolipauper]TDQ12000.1 hypothetical protein ATK78_1130 [Pedobacter metabolipauper]
MKRLFQHLFILFLVSLFLFWLLDLGFTYVFQKGNYTKIQWLDKVKDQKFDYAIHGSSRAFTTIDIPQIGDSTGKKGINISVDGSSIPDQYLMLKLFLLKNNTVKKLYLQVDPFSSDMEEVFEFAVPKFFPYIKDDVVFDHFKQFGKEWYAYRYIPFYRYAKYNTLWGIHEVINDKFSVLPQDFDQFGDFFYPNVNYKAPEKLRHMTFDLKGKYKFLNLIIDLCKQYNIKLILFTAPVADIIIDNDYKNNAVAFGNLMKSKGVAYYNYGDLYGNDPKMFFNEIHLSKSGATDFTKQIMEIFR